eukprot:CAMPEP_0180803440 /NCGR_PEP_ID=MMETSP1038_2-20121128/60899_1 /TAXON_ID=632150 /ORGANISM="Azadinium spinosum, Strain 3D9" /LENGTH=46 /DNA_ID= /DNA_START= /DNA_END= /DNA_ORIENTATION=
MEAALRSLAASEAQALQRHGAVCGQMPLHSFGWLTEALHGARASDQ